MNLRWRLTAFVLVGIFVLTGISSSCSSGKKNDEPPKFFIHKKDIDVGEVYEGVDINHTYTVRNNGAGELHILGVRPG